MNEPNPDSAPDLDPEPAPIDVTPIKLTPNRDLMDEWALVLAAVGIEHRVVRDAEGGFALGVAAKDVAAASRALEIYEAESRAAARVAPVAPDRGEKTLGMVVGAALIAFVFVTGTWEGESGAGWFAAGVADASRIRGGEWWRAVTAMTLHADVMHLLGNVAACVIFMGAAGRWLGAGVAGALILIAGTSANLLTAWTERRDHLSVGASTATFAALGLVVGLQMVRRWRGGGAIRRRAWVAAGAGLALLAMLGMGAKADVFAHAFGLGVGTLLGVVAGIVDRPPRAGAPTQGLSARPAATLGASIGNFVLSLATVGAVVAAWAHALALARR